METAFLLSVHSAPAGEPEAAPPPCEDERVALQRADGPLLIAVLDGCGGTGGRRYPQADNWSGAKLAAHLAGRALYQWFADVSPEVLGGSAPEALAEEIKTAARTALRDYNERLRAAGSGAPRIRTRLSRDLPATLAAMTAEPRPEGCRIRSYWAGNSRCYALLPGGLTQLSRDDVVGGYDPYEDLLKDGILSNSVNASEDFTVHAGELLCREPCVILTASDGVFGYLDSPMRLEWILLDALERSGSPAQWEAALRETLGEYSADDHTLQLAALGFRDFGEIKAAWSERLSTVESRWIRPWEQAQSRQDAREMTALWEDYRGSYLISEKGDGDGGAR